MGRIDAIISDELEAKLRMEVVKRFGGKKGDLQKTVEEALTLWIDKPLVDSLKKVATNAALLSSDQEKAVEAIGEVGGYAAELALSEIANESKLMSSVRQLAIETTKKIRRESKSVIISQDLA